MRIRFAGVEIGSTERAHGDVVITDLEFGAAEYVVQDSQREGRDGISPGRDYLGRSVVAFSVASNRRTTVQARESLQQLLAAWRRRSIRFESGQLVALDYAPLDMGGAWFRIYGRPRSAEGYKFDLLMRQGVGTADLEFEQMDPRFFAGGSGGEQQVTVRAVAQASGTGWRFPARFPLRSAEIPRAASAVLDVGGTEPTAPIITFRGPGSKFRLDGNQGWSMRLAPSVSLAADEAITIDPLAGRVRDNFRRSRFGALDATSTLGGLELTPGTETVFFSADDPTGVAHALIRWRDAYPSP